MFWKKKQFKIRNIGNISYLLVPETMTQLHVRSKDCMAPLHVQSKVCKVCIYLRSLHYLSDHFWEEKNILRDGTFNVL